MTANLTATGRWIQDEESHNETLFRPEVSYEVYCDTLLEQEYNVVSFFITLKQNDIEIHYIGNLLPMFSIFLYNRSNAKLV